MARACRASFLCIGLFFVSAATLLYELDLTRVFAISEWHHYAFLVVSLAFLGFGAGGTLLASMRLRPSLYLGWLPWLSLLFSGCVIGSYLFVNYVPFDSFALALQPSQIGRLAARYAVLCTPFFFAGCIVTSLFISMPARPGTLYFWNLLGSGLGPVLLLILIPPSGAGGVPFLAAGLGALAGALFAGARFRLCIGSAVLACAMVAAGFLHFPLAEVQMSPYKRLSYDLQYPGAQIFARASTPTALIEVLQSSGVRWAPGLSFAFDGALPPQMGLYLDGSIASAVTESRQVRPNSDFVRFLPGALPYRLKASPRVLVLQPRGGVEVTSALRLGARQVTVVEPESAVARLMKSSLADFTGNIYLREDVRLAKGGARSFARHTPDRFDIIAVPIADEIGLVTEGAFSFTEDYIYTVEGMKDFLSLLEPDGMLAATRWLQSPPTELLRAAGTIIEALELLGADDPARHLAVVRSLSTVTFLAKRGAITPGEQAEILSFCEAMQFEAIRLPDPKAHKPAGQSLFVGENFRPMLEEVLNPQTRRAFYKDYEYDVRPATDDRPFFAHFFRWGQLPTALRLMGKRWLPYAGSGYLFLLIVFGLALLFSGALILLPAAVFSKPPAGGWRFLPYFFLLGMAFLSLEISLMHHFILFLDRPTYAFAAVMGALLVFSGVGALLSERLPERLALRLLVLLALLSVLYAFGLHAMFMNLLGLPLPVRAGVSFLALAPLGVLMGMPFPTGLRLAARASPWLIPWAWAINGAASVLAAIGAIMLCLTWGYSPVLAMAGGLYFLSFLAGLTLLRVSEARTEPAG